MQTLPFLALIFLVLSFLSLWFSREKKIWGSLAGASLLCGLMTGQILWIGLVPIAVLALLWMGYMERRRVLLFIALVVVAFAFIFQWFPGYVPVPVTPHFHLGLEKPFIGLFPLALLVPLSATQRDWKKVFKGLGWGCAGIAVLAILATLAGATHWNFKLPSFPIIRIGTNLFLTAIPEEGFFRGFMQRELGHYFHNTRAGKLGALFLTSAIFALAHLYWSPNVTILAFVFLASLLYGGVYLVSGKIESAILTHFLLNLIHMTFFEYHAM